VESVKKYFYLSLAVILVTVFSAAFAFAFGPHDNECTECHSIHNAMGNKIIGVKPLTGVQNPSTGKELTGNSTLCLGCHNEDEGIIPIDLKKTHPVGMKPNKVNVPQDSLAGDGTLVCRSCHDPHPANPNHKYLIADTKGGREMGNFCQVCHPEKRAKVVPKK
jgi:predicted CXXCH cytochrome family protein